MVLFLEARPTAGRRRRIANSLFILRDKSACNRFSPRVPYSLEIRLAQAWPLQDWYSAGMLIAVSGGPDSVALACALAACAKHFLHPPGQLALAHYNHRLRGTRSDADEQFVASLAAQLSLPLCLGRRPDAPELPPDTAAYAHTANQRIAPSTPQQTTDAAPCQPNKADAVRVPPTLPSSRPAEAQLRHERYRFLLQTAHASQLAYVAVGHTADDQAETILHRLLRGTGIAGLAGMPQCRPLGTNVTLVRPLLPFRRQEVLEYLAQRGQAFCLDESNVDPTYTRNRLRRSLLPALKAQFNPRVVEALLRLGEQAAQLAELARSLGAAAYARALLMEEHAGFSLDCRILAAEPRAVVREALLHGWRRLSWPEGSMNARHWERLVRMATDTRAPTRYSLPRGIAAMRRGGRLILSRHGHAPT